MKNMDLEKHKLCSGTGDPQLRMSLKTVFSHSYPLFYLVGDAVRRHTTSKASCYISGSLCSRVLQAWRAEVLRCDGTGHSEWGEG
jgi:hypothetical protein